MGWLAVYRTLYDYYGPQHWWPAETSFEIPPMYRVLSGMSRAIEAYGTQVAPLVRKEVARRTADG